MQHCCFEIDYNHNDSYEITMNDQDRKINEIRDVIFCLQPSIKAKVGMSTKLSSMKSENLIKNLV